MSSPERTTPRPVKTERAAPTRKYLARARALNPYLVKAEDVAKPAAGKD